MAGAPERPRRAALSPSRASDFKSCPLLYRFRAIDRIPEPSSPAALRGTLVHAVLQEMFGNPAADRTADAATARVTPIWAGMTAAQPELSDAVPAAELDAWLASAGRLVRTYFGLEDPTTLEPEACELRVEVELADGVPLRGFIDRLDVGRGGELRIVDYKTGRSPAEAYSAGAMYQLKFYALMLYRLRGVLPAKLRLLYLGDNRTLEYAPSEPELLAFERSVIALWRAIERATAAEYFPPRRSRLCDFCAHRVRCPEFGGTPPPFPSAGHGAGGAGGAPAPA